MPSSDTGECNGTRRGLSQTGDRPRPGPGHAGRVARTGPDGTSPRHAGRGWPPAGAHHPATVAPWKGGRDAEPSSTAGAAGRARPAVKAPTTAGARWGCLLRQVLGHAQVAGQRPAPGDQRTPLPPGERPERRSRHAASGIRRVPPSPGRRCRRARPTRRPRRPPAMRSRAPGPLRPTTTAELRGRTIGLSGEQGRAVDGGWACVAPWRTSEATPVVDG